MEVQAVTMNALLPLPAPMGAGNGRRCDDNDDSADGHDDAVVMLSM